MEEAESTTMSQDEDYVKENEIEVSERPDNPLILLRPPPKLTTVKSTVRLGIGSDIFTLKF